MKMNTLVILIGVLQACNTRKVQHSSVKQSLKKSMLRNTLHVFGKSLGVVTQSKGEA